MKLIIFTALNRKKRNKQKVGTQNHAFLSKENLKTTTITCSWLSVEMHIYPQILLRMYNEKNKTSKMSNHKEKKGNRILMV